MQMDHFISLGEFGTLTLIRPTPEKLDVVSKVQLTDKHGDKRIKYPAWAAPVSSQMGFSTSVERIDWCAWI